MKYLKTFESYSVINEITTQDLSKVKVLLSSIKNSIKDEKLYREIEKFVDMNTLDPYNTYYDIARGISITFPELEEVPEISDSFKDLFSSSI